MPLPTLALLPDSQGYNVDEGDPNVAVQLDGGAARVRADKVGAVHTVTLQWTVGTANYEYLKAFFRTSTNNAALPFLMQLIIDHSTPDTYTCQFIPGTFKLKSQIGLTYVVGAQLWVVPSLDTTGDAAVLAAGPVA